MSLLASIEVFVRYLGQPTTLLAVVGPAVVSALCLATVRPRHRHGVEWRAFVLGTLISMLVSFWRETDEVLALHLLPGYALVLVWLPSAQRPHPARAYAFCFASLLVADLYCAWKYMWLTQAGIGANVYLGVGGAGAGDALFIVPPLCALMVLLFDAVERARIGHLPLLAAGRQLLKR